MVEFYQGSDRALLMEKQNKTKQKNPQQPQNQTTPPHQLNTKPPNQAIKKNAKTNQAKNPTP